MAKSIKEATPERVEYTFPRGKDDVVIGHNGKLYQYQRGVKVTLPADVLKTYLFAQANQDMADDTVSQLSNG